MKIGSDAYKELFCQSFIASHRPHEPEPLLWYQFNSMSLEQLLHPQLLSSLATTKLLICKLLAQHQPHCQVGMSTAHQCN
ncbi:MAG TPA: hypothetical protein V6D14_19370 [Coleofasciculaceae cyanobacterium]